MQQSERSNVSNSTNEEQQDMDEIKAGESIESSEGVPLPMPTDQEGQGEEEAEQSSQGAQN
jgi:hypothetical protein